MQRADDTVEVLVRELGVCRQVKATAGHIFGHRKRPLGRVPIGRQGVQRMEQGPGFYPLGVKGLGDRIARGG